LNTLKQTEPGSFHSGDQDSYILDAQLNHARVFLVDLIQDKATEMKVVTLACKVLLMLGLARSNVEDFLILSALLSKPRTFTIDLRDELKILHD